MRRGHFSLSPAPIFWRKSDAPKPGLWFQKLNAQFGSFALYSFLVHHGTAPLRRSFCFSRGSTVAFRPSLPISAERRERSRPSCAFPGETPSRSHFGRRLPLAYRLLPSDFCARRDMLMVPFEWNQCHRRVEGQNCVPSRSSFPLCCTVPLERFVR